MLKKIAKLLLVSILCVMILLITSADYLLDSFGEVDFATVVYQLNSSLEGTNKGVIVQYIEQALIPAMVGMLFLIFLFYGLRKIEKRLCMQFRFDFFGIQGKYHFGNKKERIFMMFISSLLVIMTIAVKINEVGIPKYVKDITDVSVIFEENYADPDEVELIFPKQKKNLIYIFLESMETTYASIEEGGGKAVNYIPELTNFAEKYISFSQGDKKNGLFATSGASWTMAGLLASTSGVPYLMPIEGNSAGEYDTILPGLTNLGDILEREGYSNYFMCGSEAEFAGRKLYFEQHGNYSIYDYNKAIEEGYIPSDYKVFWGMEDRKLYEWAKVKLSEIAESGKPFNFTMLTVDTHHSEGYVCELCGTKYEEQYANVISCADKQIAVFLDWLEEQDWYEDTVVVLQGDHRSMNSNFWDDLPEKYVRGIYNCFINTNKTVQSEQRVATSLDMFPSTLSALGIEIPGDRLGLGTDLFSETPTLAEEMGEWVFFEETAKYSKFYNDKFIKGVR